MKNITERIIKDNHSADELEVFLGTRGDSSQKEPRKVVYEGGHLIIEYSADNQLSSIYVDEDYNESMIHNLELEVAEGMLTRHPPLNVPIYIRRTPFLSGLHQSINIENLCLLGQISLSITLKLISGTTSTLSMGLIHYLACFRYEPLGEIA
ncbi:MAG: hypothetical protein AB2787_04815 [Candidatus Thiodiazotropha endolucinida]